MSELEEYRRATNINLPDDHVTKKVKAIGSDVPKNVRWIEVAEALVLAFIALLGIAIRNGWLG